MSDVTAPTVAVVADTAGSPKQAASQALTRPPAHSGPATSSAATSASTAPATVAAGDRDLAEHFEEFTLSHRDHVFQPPESYPPRDRTSESHDASASSSSPSSSAEPDSPPFVQTWEEILCVDEDAEEAGVFDSEAAEDGGQLPEGSASGPSMSPVRPSPSIATSYQTPKVSSLDKSVGEATPLVRVQSPTSLAALKSVPPATLKAGRAVCKLMHVGEWDPNAKREAEPYGGGVLLSASGSPGGNSADYVLITAHTVGANEKPQNFVVGFNNHAEILAATKCTHVYAVIAGVSASSRREESKLLLQQMGILAGEDSDFMILQLGECLYPEKETRMASEIGDFPPCRLQPFTPDDKIPQLFFIGYNRLIGGLRVSGIMGRPLELHDFDADVLIANVQRAKADPNEPRVRLAWSDISTRVTVEDAQRAQDNKSLTLTAAAILKTGEPSKQKHIIVIPLPLTQESVIYKTFKGKPDKRFRRTDPPNARIYLLRRFESNRDHIILAHRTEEGSCGGAYFTADGKLLAVHCGRIMDKTPSDRAYPDHIAFFPWILNDDYTGSPFKLEGRCGEPLGEISHDREGNVILMPVHAVQLIESWGQCPRISPPFDMPLGFTDAAAFDKAILEVVTALGALTSLGGNTDGTHAYCFFAGSSVSGFRWFKKPNKSLWFNVHDSNRHKHSDHDFGIVSDYLWSQWPKRARRMGDIEEMCATMRGIQVPVVVTLCEKLQELRAASKQGDGEVVSMNVRIFESHAEYLALPHYFSWGYGRGENGEPPVSVQANLLDGPVALNLYHRRFRLSMVTGSTTAAAPLAADDVAAKGMPATPEDFFEHFIGLDDDQLAAMKKLVGRKPTFILLKHLDENDLREAKLNSHQIRTWNTWIKQIPSGAAKR